MKEGVWMMMMMSERRGGRGEECDGGMSIRF